MIYKAYSFTPDSYLWLYKYLLFLTRFHFTFHNRRKSSVTALTLLFLIRPVYFPIYTYVTGEAPSHHPILRLPLPDQLIVHIFSIVH